MASDKLTDKLVELLAQADVHFNGDNDWDIQVKHHKLYDRIIQDGSLGFGESYMDGWWECKDLEGLFARLLKSKIHRKYKELITPGTFFDLLKLQMSKKVDPYQVGRHHYDIGNDLYEKMLGKSMAYSCGYWKGCTTLDESQDAKYELICQKMDLKPNMLVLDIGCGWGSLMAYMCQKYDVRCVGLTVSSNQKEWIDSNYQKLDMECHLMDYKEFSLISNSDFGEFDRVVSVGMFEHVGLSNYSSFLNICYDLLKDGGLFLLHTIGNQFTDTDFDPWIDTYIFPNGKLPSISQIVGHIENTFVLEDLHNFGPYYEKTLLAWFNNFDKAWPKLREVYGDRFYRMWKYYLYSCAGAFKARNIHLWQIVLTKGRSEVYNSFR
jgi:cyclopropane-fatty-acyl-phospholipid synthase